MVVVGFGLVLLCFSTIFWLEEKTDGAGFRVVSLLMVFIANNGMLT